MKYFFQAVLLGYFVAAIASTKLTSKPAKPHNDTKKTSQCNVNNYNSFYAGPQCKKIESMFSEVRQQLSELKEEIKAMKGNQSEGPSQKGL